jgi:hypothetical protein
MDVVGYLEFYTDERREYLLPLKAQKYGRLSTTLIEVWQRPTIIGRVGYIAVWIEPLRFMLNFLPPANAPFVIQAAMQNLGR